MRTIILGALLVLSLGSIALAESAPATPTAESSYQWVSLVSGIILGGGVVTWLTLYLNHKQHKETIKIMQMQHLDNLAAPFSLALHQKRLDACLALCEQTMAVYSSIRELYHWQKIILQSNWEGKAFEGVRSNNRAKSTELGNATFTNGIELLKVWGKYVPLFSKEFNRKYFDFRIAIQSVEDIANDKEPVEAMEKIEVGYQVFMKAMQDEMNRKAEIKDLAEKSALLPKGE
jgi:hypothetical protein